MVGFEFIGSVGRRDRQGHMVGVLHRAGDRVLPAQIDQRQLRGALGQIAFDVILLQVDEGRARMAGVRQQVEAVDQFLLEEHLADVPRHALGHHARATAQPIENVERAFGEADGARAGRQRVVVVEQHHRHTALRQVDGQGQADRAGTDHHHRPAHRRRGRLVRVAGVVEHQRLVVDVHALGRSGSVRVHEERAAVSLRASPTSLGRARLSRCAGREIA